MSEHGLLLSYADAPSAASRLQRRACYLQKIELIATMVGHRPALNCAEGSTCPQWAQPSGRACIRHDVLGDVIIAGPGMGYFLARQPGPALMRDCIYRAYEEASARVQGLKRGGSRFSKLGGLENQEPFYDPARRAAR